MNDVDRLLFTILGACLATAGFLFVAVIRDWWGSR